MRPGLLQGLLPRALCECRVSLGAGDKDPLCVPGCVPPSCATAVVARQPPLPIAQARCAPANFVHLACYTRNCPAHGALCHTPLVAKTQTVLDYFGRKGTAGACSRSPTCDARSCQLHCRLSWCAARSCQLHCRLSWCAAHGNPALCRQQGCNAMKMLGCKETEQGTWLHSKSAFKMQAMPA
jgi:hypothetical protein